MFCEKLRRLKAADDRTTIPDSADELTYWQELGVRHGGILINKGMLNAVHLFWAHVDSTCLRTIELLDREFGREVISTGYTKIMRIIQCGQKLGLTQAKQQFPRHIVVNFPITDDVPGPQAWQS